jgi:tripartite-type tricarboxylate transporter receptor subunit TctC
VTFFRLELSGRRMNLVKTVAMTSSIFVSGVSRFISVQAQEAWPSRPIRIVSAGSPGSTSDIFVRILEARLRERLGQNIILENKPGAGGMVAAGVVANSAPDGHTFFVSNVATNSIGVTLYKKPSFDPKRELPAVARIATLTNGLAVRSDRGINTLADLLSYLKANPKQALFGSAGSGTTSHLAGVLFSQKTGIEATHVPYKGTAANLTALLGGG